MKDESKNEKQSGAELFNRMKNKIDLKFLAFLLIVGVFLLFYGWLKPRSISQYTNKINVVTIKDPAAIVPVQVATIRYDIPAPYLGHVGYWFPEKRVYGGPLTMEIKGTDFSPASRSADPAGAEKILGLWMVSTQQIRGSAGKSTPPHYGKISAKTIEEFDAEVTKGSYPLPLIRAPELDRSGLTAYRGGFKDETYVGQKAEGGLFVLDCLKDQPGLMALCFVTQEDSGVHIEYNFSKRYIADAEYFYIGLIKLLDSFKRK